jgi:hypothetical protein
MDTSYDEIIKEIEATIAACETLKTELQDTKHLSQHTYNPLVNYNQGKLAGLEIALNLIRKIKSNG